MSTVSLNVVSEGNVNCTSYASLFDTDKMSGIRANQNPATTPTFTEAGDTQNIMSAWSFTSPAGKLFDGQVLYWTIENAVTVRTVRIYSNSTRTNLVAEGTRTIANGANAVIFLREVNESGIEGSVLVTIGGGGANDDTDVANTITIANIYANSDLELAGATEFIYQTPDELRVKYTVTETISQITVLAGGVELFAGEAVGYIDSTTGFTTGASYAVMREDGLGELTIPAGAKITNGFYYVNNTFTSATDAATIALGVETDAATGLKTATAISTGTTWDASATATLLTPVVATTSTWTAAATAERRIIYTLAGAEDLTAGKMRIYIKYVVVA